MILSQTFCIFLIGSATLGLTGCSANAYWSEDGLEIEEDFTEYAEEVCETTADSFSDNDLSYLGILSNEELNEAYNMDEKLVDLTSYNADRYNLKFDGNHYYGEFKMTGGTQIWEMKADEDQTVELPYTFLVKSGMAKLILVDDYNQVTTLVERTAISEVPVGEKTLKVSLKKGNNLIKLIAKDNAQINLELEAVVGKIYFDEEE